MDGWRERERSLAMNAFTLSFIFCLLPQEKVLNNSQCELMMTNIMSSLRLPSTRRHRRHCSPRECAPVVGCFVEMQREILASHKHYLCHFLFQTFCMTLSLSPIIVLLWESAREQGWRPDELVLSLLTGFPLVPLFISLTVRSPFVQTDS